MVKFLNAGLVYKSLVSKFSSKTKPIYYMPPIFWKKQYKTAVSELSQEGCLHSSRGLNVQKITSLNPIVILVIFHEKKLLANTYCVVKKNLPIQNTLTRDRCLQ